MRIQIRGAAPVRQHVDSIRRKWSSFYAGRANISKGYLCLTFKKQIGLSIIEYLTEHRIQHAIQLLQDTDDKILSIALDSGFGDLSHFNRIFKKLNHLSPSAYRTQQTG
jgi:AraC-like DNA-binding protein